jgi:glucosylceramidase
MKNIFDYKITIKLSLLAIVLSGCSATESTPTPTKPPVTEVITSFVDSWVTKGDRSVLLQKQTAILGFSKKANTNPSIEIDESQKFQTVDGFGFSLTGGSAEVINKLNLTKRQELLQELFGNGASGIGLSYLRVSIGASDLNSSVFTYNDLPAGQTDVDQTKFSLAPDAGVISLLKEILVINPNIKIMGSPWTAPAWMKTNNNFKGGSLNPIYYASYSKYFVKYIQAMKAEGITIDAITIQNEPENPYNTPSLVMTASEQTNFIKNNLGPDFSSAGLNTKIVTFDHNCDHPNYPIAILNDSNANPFVDGSAFHLYAGDISALTTVHVAYPNKNVYFTEQYTDSDESNSNFTFASYLKSRTKDVIIGSMRNWSKIALQWNLASDPSFNPHTSDGGCSVCRGALIVSGTDSYIRNVGYYITAHASKFIPAGSIRIASNVIGDLNNVAFLTPDGKKVLLVENDGATGATFNIKYNGKSAVTTLDAGAVGTYIW